MRIFVCQQDNTYSPDREWCPESIHTLLIESIHTLRIDSIKRVWIDLIKRVWNDSGHHWRSGLYVVYIEMNFVTKKVLQLKLNCEYLNWILPNPSEYAKIYQCTWNTYSMMVSSKQICSTYRVKSWGSEVTLSATHLSKRSNKITKSPWLLELCGLIKLKKQWTFLYF